MEQAAIKWAEGRRDGKATPCEPELSDLEWVGCHTRRMTLAEYERHEERVEFYDSHTQLAVFANEAAHRPHEGSRERLPMLLACIAQFRGAPITCLGELEIRRRFAGGHSRHILPDQTVYLDPATTDRIGPLFLTAGDDEPKPDVVMEVDSTTDVRRNRLALYEAWEFPEVWIEVPSAYAPGRPRGLRPGLRIHLLTKSGYVPADESRAFPTWRAEEIHQALNERVSSKETLEVLERVGRALGALEGTGPEDDPILGKQRAEGRAEMVRAMFLSRGIPVPPGFPASHERDLIETTSAEAIFRTASTAKSVADFCSRLREGNA